MRHPRPKPTDAALARPRYFNRQVVLPTDLTQDQTYALERFRRQNRLFHGWGVYIGLGVEPVKEDTTAGDGRKTDGTAPMEVEPKSGQWVVVRPGYALTPYGDEIVVPWPAYVNVLRERPDGTLVVAPAGCQPATGERAPNRADGDWALVVEAWEEPAGAVRTSADRCGDHPDHFEFARTEDTFVFRLVFSPPKDELPVPYPDAPPDTDRILRGDARRRYVRIGTVKFSGGKMSGASDSKFEALQLQVKPKTT